MFGSAEFWVLMAFIIFLGIFGKKAFAFMIQAIDEYRNKVAGQLDEAQRLHDEAQSLLQSYQKKHDEAVEQAKKIISFAEEEAKEFKRASEAEFERFMKSKEKALLERMAVEREEVISHLRKQALNEAISIIEEKLSKNKNARNKLTEASLKEISELSHL